MATQNQRAQSAIQQSNYPITMCDSDTIDIVSPVGPCMQKQTNSAAFLPQVCSWFWNSAPEILKGQFWVPLQSRMQYLAQVSQPRGHHFYQNCHISNPGGTILTKNVLFPTQGAGIWSNMSYLQPRGHNFNQKCHIANTCGMILAKFIIKYILNT